MQIPITSDLDSLKTTLGTVDVILDAIFRFLFKPPVLAPFNEVLPLLTQSKLPIVSMDISSGWDVENGKPSDPFPGPGSSDDKKVDALDLNIPISLITPKEGVREVQRSAFPWWEVHSKEFR